MKSARSPKFLERGETRPDLAEALSVVGDARGLESGNDGARPPDGAGSALLGAFFTRHTAGLHDDHEVATDHGVVQRSQRVLNGDQRPDELTRRLERIKRAEEF